MAGLQKRVMTKYLYISTIANSGLEIAEEGIDALAKSIDLYKTILDNEVPLKQKFSEIGDYPSSYSRQAASLTREVNTKVTDGLNAVTTASSKASELCTDAVPTLNNLIDQIDQNDAQPAILIKLLDDGIQKLTAGQDGLADSSASFEAASGKLSSLNIRLESDFNTKSEYYKSQILNIHKTTYTEGASFFLFGILISSGQSEAKLIPKVKAKMASIQKSYKELTTEVSNTLEIIDALKATLEGQIRQLDDLKAQAEEIETFGEIDENPELTESVLNLAHYLIKECSAYQTKHESNQ